MTLWFLLIPPGRRGFHLETIKQGLIYQMTKNHCLLAEAQLDILSRYTFTNLKGASKQLPEHNLLFKKESPTETWLQGNTLLSITTGKLGWVRVKVIRATGSTTWIMQLQNDPFEWNVEEREIDEPKEVGVKYREHKEIEEKPEQKEVGVRFKDQKDQKPKKKRTSDSSERTEHRKSPGQLKKERSGELPSKKKERRSGGGIAELKNALKGQDLSKEPEKRLTTSGSEKIDSEFTVEKPTNSEHKQTTPRKHQTQTTEDPNERTLVEEKGPSEFNLELDLGGGRTKSPYQSSMDEFFSSTDDDPFSFSPRDLQDAYNLKPIEHETEKVVLPLSMFYPPLPTYDEDFPRLWDAPAPGKLSREAQLFLHGKDSGSEGSAPNSWGSLPNGFLLHDGNTTTGVQIQMTPRNEPAIAVPKNLFAQFSPGMIIDLPPRGGTQLAQAQAPTSVPDGGGETRASRADRDSPSELPKLHPRKVSTTPGSSAPREPSRPPEAGRNLKDLTHLLLAKSDEARILEQTRVLEHVRSASDPATTGIGILKDSPLTWLSLINGTNNPEPVPFHKDFAPDESSPSPSERNYQLRMRTNITNSRDTVHPSGSTESPDLGLSSEIPNPEGSPSNLSKSGGIPIRRPSNRRPLPPSPNEKRLSEDHGASGSDQRRSTVIPVPPKSVPSPIMEKRFSEELRGFKTSQSPEARPQTNLELRTSWTKDEIDERRNRDINVVRSSSHSRPSPDRKVSEKRQSEDQSSIRMTPSSEALTRGRTTLLSSGDRSIPTIPTSNPTSPNKPDPGHITTPRSSLTTPDKTPTPRDSQPKSNQTTPNHTNPKTPRDPSTNPPETRSGSGQQPLVSGSGVASLSSSAAQTQLGSLERPKNQAHPSSMFLQFQNHFSNHPIIYLEPSQALDRAIHILDNTLAFETHKIGVLYVGRGQTTEEEILSNTHGSPLYTEFLRNLGNIIQLNECDGGTYTGGLDRSEEARDGRFSIFWKDDVTHVMFHVATLMPTTSADQKHTNKKRHIGNDYVHVVYNDSGNLTYNTSTLSGQFNFVVITITPRDPGFFCVTILRKPGVPNFGPINDTVIVPEFYLARLVREVAISGNIASQILDEKNKTLQYVSNCEERLRQFKQIADRFGKGAASSSPQDRRSTIPPK